MNKGSNEFRDVVVVGGGIVGAALATSLARHGLDVLVLERESAFRDRGLGEYVQPWGVAELRALDLLDVLLAAGSAVGTDVVRFERGAERSGSVRHGRVDDAVPGTPGSLKIDHPRAATALLEAALAVGADVVRGARVQEVTTGPAPVVGYAVDGREARVQCRLVVGADGRRSVVRAAAGGTLSTRVSRLTCDSLLLGGVEDWPAERIALGNTDGAHFILLSRYGGTARLYRFRADQGREPAGHRSQEVLGSARTAAAPWGAWLEGAQVAGPCVRHRMDDARTDDPIAPGTTLVGDAAGWSNPLIGQGMSIGFFDVRSVTDALTGRPGDRARRLERHRSERAELLRRLRLSSDLAVALQGDFAPGAADRRARFAERAEQDVLLGVPLSAYVTGPLAADPTAFTSAHVRRLRAVLLEGGVRHVRPRGA